MADVVNGVGGEPQFKLSGDYRTLPRMGKRTIIEVIRRHGPGE